MKKQKLIMLIRKNLDRTWLKKIAAPLKSSQDIGSKPLAYTKGDSAVDGLY